MTISKFNKTKCQYPRNNGPGNVFTVSCRVYNVSIAVRGKSAPLSSDERDIN